MASSSIYIAFISRDNEWVILTISLVNKLDLRASNNFSQKAILIKNLLANCNYTGRPRAP